MKKLIIVFVLLCVELTAQGQIWLWVSALGCSQEGWMIAADNKTGDIYTTTALPCSYWPLSTSNNCGLYKIGPNGSAIWAKCTDYFPTEGSTFPSAVCTDQRGNIVLVGSFHDSVGFDSNLFVANHGGLGNCFIAEFNSSGRNIWLTGSSATSSKGCYVNVKSLNTDKDDNILIGGSYTDSIVFDTMMLPGNWTGSNLLIKFNSNGIPLWVNHSIGPTSITTDNSNNIYESAGGVLEALDSNGHYKWFASAIPASTNGQMTISSIIVDNFSHLWLTGWFTDTVMFQSYILYSTHGHYSSFLMQCDTNGRVISGTVFNGNSQNYSVAVDNSRNVYVSGGIFDTVFLGSTILAPPEPSTQDNSYIIKLDSTLNLLCYSVENAGGDDMNTIVTDPLGPNVYFCGDAKYYDTAVFSRDTIINNNEGTLNEYPIIGKWTCDNIEGLNSIIDKRNIVIFPNPSSGVFNINSTYNMPFMMRVYNMLGEEIYISPVLTGNTNEIDLSSQPAGIYLYRVFSGRGEFMVSGKIVIEK